ncbi:MAG: hypothetical protein HGA73_03110 [Syntrophaceae bacterium]|nr:hypothetical protein [Syntrophaceae bacterium]NTW60855.1 hypothetical protein [Nitrospirota bacterium]
MDDHPFDEELQCARSWIQHSMFKVAAGANRDTDLLSQFAYPSNYSITITPSAAGDRDQDQVAGVW